MKSTNIFLQFEFNQLRNSNRSVEDMQDDFIKYEIAEVKDEKEKVQTS